MFNRQIYLYLLGLAVIFYIWQRSLSTSENVSRWYQKDDGKVRKLPPGPLTYWPFGTDLLYRLAKMYDRAFPLYLQWREQTKSNTIMMSALGDVGLLVFDPESIQHFLVKNWKNYQKGEKFMDSFNDLLGDGIFNSNGDKWQNHRSAARPHFQRMELNMMVPTMTRHTKYLLAHLDRACAAGQPVDIQKYFFQLTLDSACEIFFGTNIDTLNDPTSRFGAAFDIVQAQTSYRITVYPLWKAGLLPDDATFAPSLEYLNGFVDKIVADTFADKNLDSREDLLAQYIKASRADHPAAAAAAAVVEGEGEGEEKSQYGATTAKAEEEQTNPIYLRNMLKNMLIAGRDTTACLLTWCVFELSQRPDVEAKLLEEIAEHIGLDNDAPTGEQLAKLKYMKMVLNETLRLHPSVPVDVRTSVEEDWLPNGYYVPPKTDVIYSAFVTQKLPEFWGEDAERFEPTRWETERIRSVPAFAFVPFHAGPRICLGQNMAYEEAKIALVLLLQKFSLRLVGSPAEVEYRNIIILQVRGQLNMHITRREPISQ